MKPLHQQLEGSLERTKLFGGKLLIVAFAIALGLLAAYAIMNSDFSGAGGSVRNCIKSALGNLPDCNDGPGGDGSLKQTMVNGKIVGICRSVRADGACVQ